MSLDLTRVAAQVAEMVTRLKTGLAERQTRLDYALDTLHRQADDLERLKRKIIASRTTWLVAGLVEGLAQRYPASPLPAEFTVIATDGSHIDVDRHRSARCCLINIGQVVLHYGSEPEAILESVPHLYAEERDLVMAPSEGKGREQPMEGALLGARRSVEECRHLAEMAAELPQRSAVLALLDGSLILWGLEAYPEFVSEMLVDRGLLTHFDRMRELNRDRELALASYISRPRATDVVNALRVAICPHEPVDCDRFCAAIGKRECDAVAGLQDRELFASLLAPGERSALFISQSSVVKKRYREHTVYFFYLRGDDEIARVEIPQWVAGNKELVGLMHSLVLDQCQRGQGYPVALSEAHEQAVVTTADRDNFWQLVEANLVEEHLPTPTSGKSRSKRTRWV